MKHLRKLFFSSQDEQRGKLKNELTIELGSKRKKKGAEFIPGLSYHTNIVVRQKISDNCADRVEFESYVTAKAYLDAPHKLFRTVATYPLCKKKSLRVFFKDKTKSSSEPLFFLRIEYGDNLKGSLKSCLDNIIANAKSNKQEFKLPEADLLKGLNEFNSLCKAGSEENHEEENEEEEMLLHRYE